MIDLYLHYLNEMDMNPTAFVTQNVTLISTKKDFGLVIYNAGLNIKAGTVIYFKLPLFKTLKNFKGVDKKASMQTVRDTSALIRENRVYDEFEARTSSSNMGKTIKITSLHESDLFESNTKFVFHNDNLMKMIFTMGIAKYDGVVEADVKFAKYKTVSFKGKRFRVNPTGYLFFVDDYSPEWVVYNAKDEGITKLTPEHFKIINFVRTYYIKNHIGPMIRVLSKHTGVKLKELYELFPNGPGRSLNKLAGLPNHKGII